MSSEYLMLFVWAIGVFTGCLITWFFMTGDLK